LGSATETTTHLPSGDRAGAPTRFIIHRASWVTGWVPPAGWAASVSGEEATTARRTAREAARAFIESSPVGWKGRNGRMSDCKRRSRPIGSRHGSYLEFRLTEGRRGQ